MPENLLHFDRPQWRSNQFGAAGCWRPLSRSIEVIHHGLYTNNLAVWLMRYFVIKDGGRHHQSELEAKIRWADAFVLIYSVTDKCSFDECCRLRFLIGYNKRRRKHLVGFSLQVSFISKRLY